jgi:2-(1,2-epoxy-1,2-dihydrophenyl)acetyl-CoA isomerase
MVDEPLLTENLAGVMLLRLNRPEKLNALNESLIAALNAAFDVAESDAEVKALVITGTGRAFCAGGDLEMLTSWQKMTAHERRTSYLTGASLALRLAEMALPVVAAVNGVAFGAGFDLALGADICIAARSASFMSGFVGIGLVPDLGGTWWLPRIVGISRARRLVLGGERLDATRAFEWGIVQRIVDDELLIAQSVDSASKLAEWSTSTAFAEAKRALLSSSKSFADSLTEAATVQSLLMDTPEHLQRIRKLLDHG